MLDIHQVQLWCAVSDRRRDDGRRHERAPGGVVEPAEFENGSWRYRVRTNRMMVVVAFDEDSESELVVVTGWRLTR